jgi:hypothetical protein
VPAEIARAGHSFSSDGLEVSPMVAEVAKAGFRGVIGFNSKMTPDFATSGALNFTLEIRLVEGLKDSSAT